MPNVPFPNLFLSSKIKPSLNIPNGPSMEQRMQAVTIALREIERWANGSGIGVPITQVESTDGSVTVTGGTGPVVNLSVPPPSGGGYVSLTGAGETTTPGQLVQQGDFTVNASTGSLVMGPTNFMLQSAPGTPIILQQTGNQSITLQSGSGGVALNAVGGGVSIICGNGGSPPEEIDLYVPLAGGGTGAQILMTGTGTTIAGNSIGLQYGPTVGLPYTRGSEYISIGDTDDTTHGAALFTCHGNPNGVINPFSGLGSFCFDSGTPGFWIWTGSAWSMYTNP